MIHLTVTIPDDLTDQLRQELKPEFQENDGALEQLVNAVVLIYILTGRSR